MAVRRHLSVLLLPPLEVLDADLVVGIGRRRRRDVDHDRESDQLLERDRVDGLPALREVHRRIDVRAAVLRGEEVVGRVVIARRRHAIGDLVEAKSLGRRPEDGVGVVGVRQVDDLPARKLEVFSAWSGAATHPASVNGRQSRTILRFMEITSASRMSRSARVMQTTSPLHLPWDDATRGPHGRR